MEEKKLEKIENNQVEKNKGLEYEFSAQINTGNETGIVHCFSVNGVKQYKVMAKDGNFDGVDQSKVWEEKLKNDKKEREKEEIERER